MCKRAVELPCLRELNGLPMKPMSLGLDLISQEQPGWPAHCHERQFNRLRVMAVHALRPGGRKLDSDSRYET